MLKDLIIIGGGPAGITAAVYAARKMMDFAVISPDIGGQAAWSGDIENYTGYQFIAGPDLAQKFREHLNQYKFELLEGISVTKVDKGSSGFKVLTDDGKEYSAKTLIIASGKRPRTLNVTGEDVYKNHGVTYCATCDAPLFSGKDVAVIGGGNSALDAVLQLIKIAPKIYLINIADQLTGDPVMREKVAGSPKVEILNKTKVVEIYGDKFVKGIKVEQAGRSRSIPVEGVFVEAGLKPNSEFINFVEKNELDEIIVDCASGTSVPGLFAAGDVTSVPEKQIIIAAGEGAKAALGAFRYLATHAS
ncbi:MAG: FAD-dependent oxidoreductase [Candidatus Margulisbacteria bacterium]|nr:FAD-dependent oxidoreductase [Candidatus Margulisiibacteriota bacterium]